MTLNFLVSTQAKKARFALDGERVALAPLKGNNHLQRCYRSAAPVAGARLTAECADCGAGYGEWADCGARYSFTRDTCSSTA